jgi:hypothetical protein
LGQQCESPRLTYRTFAKRLLSQAFHFRLASCITGFGFNGKGEKIMALMRTRMFAYRSDDDLSHDSVSKQIKKLIVLSVWLLFSIPLPFWAPPQNRLEIELLFLSFTASMFFLFLSTVPYTLDVTVNDSGVGLSLFGRSWRHYSWSKVTKFASKEGTFIIEAGVHLRRLQCIV